MFKNRRENKKNKYKEKLQKNNFTSSEISRIIPIYNKVIRLSNIFITNILMFVVSIVMLIIVSQTKNKNLIEIKNILFWAFGIIASILVIISFVLSFVLFINVLISNIDEIRKKVLIWAILSLIPTISFITFFVMKWKISHLYKYRKNK